MRDLNPRPWAHKTHAITNLAKRANPWIVKISMQIDPLLQRKI